MMKFNKKWIVLFLCLLPVGLLSAQNIKEAREAISSEKYNDAKKILTPINSAESWYYLGDIYMQLLEFDSAKMAFKKGIQIDDKFPLNYVGLARINLQNKDTATAAINAQKAIDELRRNVRDPRTYIELMKAYGKANLFDKGIYYGEKALAVTQSNARLYVELGNLYARKNTSNLSKPVLYYRKAIRLDSTNAEAYTRLGVAWQRAKQPKRAKKNFNKAIEANPKYAPAYREKAIFFYRNDQLKKAIPIYRDKYLPLVGRTCDAVTQYIQFVFLAGDAKTAIQEINKLKAESNCENILEMDRMEGYAAYETGKYQQAVEALNGFINKAPQEKLIAADYVYLGKALAKTGKPELASENLYKALTLVDTTDKRALKRMYTELYDAFFESKKFAEAAKILQEKLDKFKLYNGYTADLRDVGRAWAFAGKYKKADTAFAKLLEIDSTYIYGYFMRAQVNAQEGMAADAAMPYYQKVIDLAKDKPEKYKSYLSQAYKYMGNYFYQKEINVQNIDSTIAYYQKWYELDPEKNKKVKEAIDALKKQKADVIKRQKIIEERKKAKREQ